MARMGQHSSSPEICGWLSRSNAVSKLRRGSGSKTDAGCCFNQMPHNELRIRVARSRDTILGWTKSGAWRLLLEFQRASMCRERCDASRTVAWTWVRKGPWSFGCTPLSDRHGPDPAPSFGGQTAPQLRDERARTSKPHRAKSTVMAHASVAGRGHPPGPRSPFDTEDSAWAEDRRRPEQAAAGGTSARWAPVAEW
jgi:hypothetical protein